MNETILVVDDEPKIVQLARDYLEKNGFKVLSSGNGQQALAITRQERPDLIVLDLMLPGMDGLDVCRAIRRESDVPIIMLTARAEEADQLIGLELGADDYITKPFSPRALVARVRALLRRAQGELLQDEVLRAGDLELDIKRKQVTLSGNPVHLTRSEFSLLETLAKHPTNWHLSAHRAISVLKVMAGSKVDPKRMSARGFGEYRPVEPNKPNKGGNPRNRRVEIYIVPKGT